MNEQTRMVQEEDWDTLIILDACRYDAFKDVHEEYLPEGSLRKVESPVETRNSYATSDWYRKVFAGRFPGTVNVSSNSRINSLMPVDGFDASQHFEEIIDVWDTGYEEEAGTVPPANVTAAAREQLDRGTVERMVVHYAQPHWPFLKFDVPGPDKEPPADRETLRFKLRTVFGPPIRYSLGPERTRRLFRVLGLPPVSYMDKVLRELGHEKLVDGYYDNLHRVLEEVADLLEHLDGTVVITADHGEMLGENEYYGHSYVPEHPAVIDVPWFELAQ